jgi:hypothetical protein
VLDERAFAAHISLVHPPELRHADMRLVDDYQDVVGKVVDQGRGSAARGTALDVAGVVLDPVAESDLPEHLEVVFGTHAKPLGLQKLALLLQHAELLGELLFDCLDGCGHPLA